MSMFNTFPIEGSGPFSGQYFSLRRRRFYLAESGWKTLRALGEIHQQCVSDRSGFWALRARPQLAAIEKLGRSSVVTKVIIHTRDDRLRLIAIWARGHLAGSLGTSTVAVYLDSPHPELRKAAVRALKRMKAYASLEQVAMSDPDQRIRRIAQFTVAKPIEERIQRYSRNVKNCETTGNAQPLLINQFIDGDTSARPKSARFIRLILQRIRRLVGRPAKFP